LGFFVIAWSLYVVNFARATVLALFIVAALTAQKTFPEILKTKLIFQFILKL